MPVKNSYRKIEQPIFGNLKRTTIEEKHPWIHIADTTTIVEESLADFHRSILLQAHGDQKSLSSRIFSKDSNALLVVGNYGQNGALSKASVLYPGIGEEYKELAINFLPKGLTVLVTDWRGECVVDRMFLRSEKVELELPRISLELGIEDSNYFLGLHHGGGGERILMQAQIDFEEVCDTIVSSQSKKWKSIFEMIEFSYSPTAE